MIVQETDLNSVVGGAHSRTHKPMVRPSAVNGQQQRSAIFVARLFWIPHLIFLQLSTCLGEIFRMFLSHRSY